MKKSQIKSFKDLLDLLNLLNLSISFIMNMYNRIQHGVSGKNGTAIVQLNKDGSVRKLSGRKPKEITRLLPAAVNQKALS